VCIGFLVLGGDRRAREDLRVSRGFETDRERERERSSPCLFIVMNSRTEF